MLLYSRISLALDMPKKCSVCGCNSGNAIGPNISRFRFPPTPLYNDLREKWLSFLN